MEIFSNLIEKVMDVFMDDFSVYGKTFEDCLANIDKLLKRCQMVNHVVNWEQCHFMVQERIVLGNKILEKGIEVDKAKIEVIEQLPPPTNLKGVRNFSRTYRVLSKIYLEFFLDCLTPHASSSQRCPICLHRRVSSIVPHFEEGTRFHTCYTAS
jgi:hypothetical protein